MPVDRDTLMHSCIGAAMIPRKSVPVSLRAKLAAGMCVLAACWIFGQIAFPIASVEQFRDGDIIFQTSTSRQSKAIQLATHSKYSHMGILFHNPNMFFQDPNGWWVFEAVGPVKETPLTNWVARGVGHHYVVKRLKQNRLHAGAVLKSAGDKFKGKPYDAYFGWSDDRIYCSELVWKIYKEGLGVEIGPLQKLRDFDLSSPTVRAMLTERYGSAVPLDEPVITPSVIFDSPDLVTVCSH